MLTISRHANQRGVSRLGFQRTRASHKLKWLCRSGQPVAGPSLPDWFKPIPSRYAPDTRFVKAIYAGIEIILVIVRMALDEVLVTVITNADADNDTM